MYFYSPVYTSKTWNTYIQVTTTWFSTYISTHLYKYHGYNMIDQIMTHMIYDNNILIQYTSTGKKDDEKNLMYIWLAKNTLYNFLDKLRSVFGQEDAFTTNKWTWFDTQMPITFLWIQVISHTLLEYTEPRRVIGYLIYGVQPPSVSGTDSNAIMTYLQYIQSSVVICRCGI